MRIRKFILFAIFVLISFSLFPQTLFTYGNKEASKQEFLCSFNKSLQLSSSRAVALKEYLPLYIHYKLKVQAGYDEELDKNSSFQLEASNYKQQLAENFINEEANEKKLMQEAFERSKKDIAVQQIFIPFGKDTIAASKQIQSAYQQLKTGKSFDALVEKYATDKETKKSKGDLGFITVFNLPYEIENIIYGLAPQHFSVPYKSKYGYHIFKNIEIRPSAGKRKVAQILLAFAPNSSQGEKNKLASLADSLYQLIQSGQSFDQLARQFNTDHTSALKNGILPEIGVGEYAIEFEEKVFSLKHINDVTKPFATSYGYHIVKLLEMIPAAKTVDEKLKVVVENSDRLAYSKQQLIKKWMIKISYRKGDYDETALQQFIDSAIYKRSIPGNKKIKDSTILFSFSKQKFTVSDFVKFVRIKNIVSPASQLLKEFTENSCTAYYSSHLEEYNPEFKQQLGEFNDANVLFAAMDKHVWGKTAEDSAGLKKYYDAHQRNYVWNPSVAALVITAKNKSMINEVAERIKQRPTDWKIIAGSYGESVIGDSGRYEMEHLPVQQKIKPEKGFLSVVEKAPNEESYSFMYVTDIFPDKAQRSFEESRGMVMNDYQKVVEEKWVEALKKKYPVKVIDVVWKTVQ